MPTKPKRPCRYPGCPKLTDGLYCADHQPQVNREYNQFQRDPNSNKRYGRGWKRIRDRYIKAHPLCEQCQKDGRLTTAQEVHHVVPLINGGSNHVDNLMSLCHSCHMKVHGTLNTAPQGVSKSLPPKNTDSGVGSCV